MDLAIITHRWEIALKALSEVLGFPHGTPSSNKNLKGKINLSFEVHSDCICWCRWGRENNDCQSAPGR